LSSKISFINLKGGVGKTTLAVNIAANLSYYHNQKVLMVDVDPQTNSTVSLISPKYYVEELKKKNRTLKAMYDAQISSKASPLNFDSIVLKGAGGVDRLDLLPSDLELIDIDIQLSRIPNNYAIVRDFLEEVFDDYDYIIFDCPPNMGLLTQNGLFASDYYVVPVQPDFLSTFGLDLVTGRVKWFKREIKKSVKWFDLGYGGLIFSRVRHTLEHSQKMMELRSKTEYDPVFKSIVYERTAISEASARSLPICRSKTGFGWAEVNEMFKECTEEFLACFPPREE
jgi:chromosome partitioning protein